MNRILAGAFVGVFAAGAAYATGADLTASFPLGDGGMFYSIVRQIVASHFAYPHIVAFNHTSIPFAYSPLAFYCLAAVVKLTAMSVPAAMNLWVIVWNAAAAPAAYVAARQFLRTRFEAVVAAGFVVIFPGSLVWLGMGGGMTRAPAFDFYLVAAGLTWAAFARRSAAFAIGAAATAALVAWFHMEFAYLYAATFVVFCLAARPRLREAAIVSLGAVLLALPWPLLARDQILASEHAIGTTHFGASFAVALFGYLGFDSSGSLLSLLGLFCVVAAAIFAKEYLWILWILVLFLLDSRAGSIAAHLPSAIAIGWCAGRARDALAGGGVRANRQAVLIAVLAGLWFLGMQRAHDDSVRYTRLSSIDAGDLAMVGKAAGSGGFVLTVFPGAVGEALDHDQTFEWLPALSGAFSPITYQGMEWISAEQAASRYVDYVELQLCVAAGPSCIVDFAKRVRARAGDVYVFVPPHGRAYPLVSSSLAADRRFNLVKRSEDGAALFRITGGL